MINVMLVLGTRPEVIKMSPIIKKLKKYREKARTLVVTTAQHREMMDQMMSAFEIEADYDLNVMRETQSLPNLTCRIIEGIDKILSKEPIDYLLVQGDTTTSFAAGLTAFYHKIKVGHVEAGLRTFNKYYPFPEEINRSLLSRFCTIHFAPTRQAKMNLLKEGIPDESIIVTGNTVVDTLMSTIADQKIIGRPSNNNTKTILLTIHRRENFGKPFENICHAILDIVNKNTDVKVVFPVHLNPNIQKQAFRYLSKNKQIQLSDPLDYFDFIKEVAKSHLILTDSGGLQEEAPSLGKPVLVLRNETERNEGIEAGTCKLVGTDTATIVKEANRLIRDKNAYDEMSKISNPYGDGKASERIVRYLLKN